MKKYAVDGWKYFGELNGVLSSVHENDFKGPGLYMLIEKGTKTESDICYYIGRDSGSILERVKYHYFSIANATYLIPLNYIMDEFQSCTELNIAFSEIDKKYSGRNNKNKPVKEKHKYLKSFLFKEEEYFKRYIRNSFEFRKRIHVLYKPCSNVKNIARDEKNMIATYGPIDNQTDNNGKAEATKCKILIDNTKKFASEVVGKRYVNPLLIPK